jgi:urease accessory protein
VEKNMNRSSAKSSARIAFGIIAALFMMPAFAHPGVHHAAASFTAGFAHPFLGADHLLALFAIGLWAVQQRRPMIWMLPLVFPLVMALGAIAAFNGIRMPIAEAGIAGSVAMLGLLIVFAVRMPAWGGVGLVSLFALLHGYAHGMELPTSGSAGLYGAGFVAATVLLHLTGLATGLFATSGRTGLAMRTIGAVIAVAGMSLLGGAV